MADLSRLASRIVEEATDEDRKPETQAQRNLRNVIGHGMRAHISTEDAALLLHAASLLRLLQPGESARDSASGE